MNLRPQTLTRHDIDRHRAQARRMRSRETARLGRRLFGSPARLLRRLRGTRAPAPTSLRHV